MKRKNFPLICSVIALVFVMFLFVPNVSAFEDNPPKFPSKNNGGYYQQGPSNFNNQPGYYNDFMARWDMNRDGVVTKKEYKGPSSTFKKMDKNHDNVIDRSEAEAGSHSPPAGGGFGGGQPNPH